MACDPQQRYIDKLAEARECGKAYIVMVRPPGGAKVRGVMIADWLRQVGPVPDNNPKYADWDRTTALLIDECADHASSPF